MRVDLYVRTLAGRGTLLATTTLLVLLMATEALGEAPEPVAPAPPPAAPKLTEGDFAKPMGPPDALNRGTPRGTVYGFVLACRQGDFERAARFLDLRRLSAEERERAPEIARKLRDALGAVLVVDWENLSDRPEGVGDDDLPAWQESLGVIQTREGQLPILLQRVPREEDGVRIWKFSASTVAQTEVLYEEFGPGWLESWLPAAFFQIRFLRVELSEWVTIIGLVVASWLASLLLAGTGIRLLGKLFSLQGLDERAVHVVRGPVRLALTALLFSGARRYVRFDLHVHELLGGTERLVLVIAMAWLFFRFVDMAVLALRVRAERRGNLGLVPALGPLQRFSKAVIVVFGSLAVLATVGVDVTAALAGVGVGGIALALAAQKTVENLFGGLSLFADQPVRVGDFFRFGDQVGTVEEIGLRSTRVRTLDRTVVTIPNGEFSNLPLENFARRDRMRIWTTIGVRYETTPDQLRFLLAGLRQILLAHPRVTDDPARIRFVGFGAYSLDLEVFAYVDTADWSEFLAIREDVYLRFMDAIKEAGTGFAFPSSTTYVGRDEGLPAEDVRRAEEAVAAWREKGELPFPSFAEERRSEIWNSLDWPPEGSPQAAKDAAAAPAT